MKQPIIIGALIIAAAIVLAAFILANAIDQAATDVVHGIINATSNL